MKLSIKLAVLLVAAPFTLPTFSQAITECALDSSDEGRTHCSGRRGDQMQDQRYIEALTAPAGKEQFKNATPASRVAMPGKARAEERLEGEAKLDELFKQLLLQQKLAEREQSRDAELQALLESEKDEARFKEKLSGLIAKWKAEDEKESLSLDEEFGHHLETIRDRRAELLP